MYSQSPTLRTQSLQVQPPLMAVTDVPSSHALALRGPMSIMAPCLRYPQMCRSCPTPTSLQPCCTSRSVVSPDETLSLLSDPGPLPAGIAFSQGTHWRTVRLAPTTLLDLGLSRQSLEEQIQEEVGCLKKELEMCGESCGSGVCVVHVRVFRNVAENIRPARNQAALGEFEKSGLFSSGPRKGSALKIWAPSSEATLLLYRA